MIYSRWATAISFALIATVFEVGLCSDFEPIVGWDGHLFPSYIVSTAKLKWPESKTDSKPDPNGVPSKVKETVIGESHGTIGIRVKSPSDNTRCELTISASDWLEPSTMSVDLPKKGETYRVMPTLKFKYKDLVANKQSMPTTVEFELKLNGKKFAKIDKSAVLHSINDCPYSYTVDEETTEIGFVFAAYVNEQHPFIDKILREALDGGIVDSFTGYQSGDEAEVLKQVYAIWDTLASRDLRYSNITAVAAESDNVGSQHVRLLDESVTNSQANCVDGSVLMASILRKIDIEPFLVFVPGHCYLAFALDEEGEHIVGLETTMIGDSDSEEDDSDTEDESLTALKELLDEETLELESLVTFCNAITGGTDDLVANSEKFDSGEDGDYQLISITEARRLGILPIAFQANKKLK